MRIVYVVNSLASKGGAERMIIEKMNFLTLNYGYEVYTICCYQNVNEPNAYPLSDKVTQIFLEIPFYSQYKYHYPYRLVVKRKLDKMLKNRLASEVQKLNPDILVGTSYFGADVVSSVDCRAKKVIEAHEPRRFTLADEGLGRSLPVKAYMLYYRKIYFQTVEEKADVVVTLTEGDALSWRKAKCVKIIPNFSSMKASRLSDLNAKRVIAVGRLEWVKGFDRLISAWAFVIKKHPDWRLDIFGEGTLKDGLLKQIKELKLQDSITIHPFTSDIHEEYAKSSILVCSSHFEGFSLVVLEAMRIGVPCVAFDCPYGPRTIIQNNKNGFYVPDDNYRVLADRINFLIKNTGRRREFSESAVLRAEQFNIDVVMEKWKELFESIVKE